MPAGIVSFDDAGILHAANAYLLALIGRSRNEIVGRHIDVLLSAAGRIFYSTHLFPMLRLHGRAEELYVPILHAGGTELPVMVNGAARPGPEATVYELVLLPMRARNRLEEELIAARNAAEEASAAKDRFLSVVSHELRSPLTGVMGYADLLLRERVGPLTDKQRTYVERIRDSSAYQVGLIEDILDFAAIVGERRGMLAVAVSVEDMIARAEAILSVRAAEDGHRLSRQPRPAPGAVLADPRSAQQILLNLGVNAIKYSPAGTAIDLRVEYPEDRVKICIRDQGPGIPSEALERIFQPFVRLPGAEAASQKGVGLGLAISRDLARAMGGDIVVESTAGEGATFTLDLPAASASRRVEGMSG